MRRLTVALIAGAVLLVLAAAVVVVSAYKGEGRVEGFEPLKPRVVDHSELFAEAKITAYEGSKTCIECHYDDTVEFFKSHHYQLASKAFDVEGRGEAVVGGRVVYNDFCTSIFLGGKPLNWIGYPKLKKAPPGYEELVGSFIGLTGCSMCHGVTMGLPPSPEPSEEQLGNIDCLACHVDPEVYVSGPKAIAKGLKTVVKDEKGRLVYKVNVDIDRIAKNIIDVPTSANCLACHAFSGGGPHLKRPNIGPDLYTGKTRDGRVFDVHIASGMSCIDCHPGEGHKFSTNCVDCWAREGDRPGEKARTCSSCHGEKPHGGVLGIFLNTFHGRVACQTCHIPVIGGGSWPTEDYRDWSATTFHPDKKRWKFAVPDPETRATDKWYLQETVEPVYTWYNGRRQVYLFPEAVEPEKGSPLEVKPVNGVSAGVVYYVKPMGSRDDPNSKIYPFKLHRAVVPYSPSDKVLVPMKVGIAFVTGNAQAAALKGAEIAGIKWDGRTYVTYVRYMQVNHGVKPAEEALMCLDCHGPVEKRMPWSELGYGNYPELAFTTLSAIAVIAIVAVVYAAGRLIFKGKA